MPSSRMRNNRHKLETKELQAGGEKHFPHKGSQAVEQVSQKDYATSALGCSQATTRTNLEHPALVSQIVLLWAGGRTSDL